MRAVNSYRALLVIALVGMNPFLGMTQTSRYKSILESERSASTEDFFAALVAFRLENPEWPNVNYKIGEVQMKFFALADPLVERAASHQYLQNAQSYFGLAKTYVDDKEARKNPDWYGVPDMKNKDSVALLVMNLVDQKLKAAYSVYDDYGAMLFHYDKAVSFYLETREIFIDINNRAENLRSLFLAVDDDLRSQLGEMIQKFDSTMFHIGKYRELNQVVPHFRKRNLTVTLEKIYHFRMNGLSPPNFLADNIRLWNYGEWATGFLKLIEVEVDGLKRELGDAYETFTNVNKMILNTDECVQANVDQMRLQRLVNLVNKYDNDSRLVDIFRFVNAKLQYDNELSYERNCNISSGNVTETLLSRKARIYQSIFASYQLADSLSRRILLPGRSNVSFQWFFDKYMNGGAGVQPFVEKQQKENNLSLREGLKDIVHLRDSSFSLSLNTDQVFVRHLDTLFMRAAKTGEDSVRVLRLAADTVSSVFLLAANNQHRIAGVTPADRLFRVNWEKPLPDRPTFFKVLTDSSFIVGGSGSRPWFQHLGMHGENILVANLPRGGTIGDIYYNDLFQSYRVIRTIAYDSTTRQGKFELINMDGRGKISGKQDLVMTGNFLALVPNENDLWFFTYVVEQEHFIINAFVMAPESQQFSPAWTCGFDEGIVDPLLVRNDNQTLTMIGHSPSESSAIIYAQLDYQGNLHHEISLKDQ